MTRSKSIVLTGSPGVGKSWTIAQLIKQCKTENRRVVALAAEDFDVNSLDELKLAIGFKTDIVSFLISFGPEPLLIIDGLDALRGESSQRAFRELMQSVTDRVPTCSIIASIRTFDFQQSIELQRLFSYTHGAARPFVSVTTQPFSDDDLRVAAEQVPALKSVLLESGQGEVRELLKNPFNLRLAVELLEGGTGISEFSTIHSQVQLLQRYWSMRVDSGADGADRKALLRQVVREMVNRNSLSIREEAAYSPGFASALKGLRSAEVLRESVTDRISFSHNILFDYAVARLMLDEEEIFTFINADSSRTIFFRPSILHFFHHLWWNDRTSFWKVASRFFASRELPERAKIVPAVVITEAGRSLADIEPLVGDQGIRRGGLPLTLRAIQALGTLQTARRHLWLDFFDRLADEIEIEFINEFVSVLAILTHNRTKIDESRIGSISRRLLRWMWRTAEGLPKYQADQLTGVAAGRVLPVVMQLYATDANASREIVEWALARFGSFSASTHNAFWLAHEIKHIIDNDPELAVFVYQRMFSHHEDSEETTVMGGSPVFTLTSTRKQDFETALYGLQQAFPYFLDTSPEHATRAALQVTNIEVLTREAQSAEGDGRRNRFTFRFLRAAARYISDYSEIWDRGAREYISVQLLSTVLQQANTMDASRLRATIQVIAENAEVAVCWKRLLEAASNNIRSFLPHILGLLSIPRFLTAPEVTVAAGNVLRAAYAEPLLNDSDKGRIEGAIERIPRSRFIKRYEKPESIQNRLLLCIGADRLLSAELRLRVQQLLRKETTFANEPYVKITGSAIAYSTEDWLRDEGADTSKQENKDALAAIKPITEFEHRFLNSVPSTEEILAIEPNLRKLHQLLQLGNVDDHISEHARGTLYAAAESIAKNQELGKDHPVLQFCKAMLLQGSADPSPKFNPKYHSQFDTPSWGSPLPRIEAAQGLSHLLWNYGVDDDVTEAFIKLTKDEVPAVRYQTAVGLLGFYKYDKERFWNLVSQLMAAETTPGVMLGLLNTLGQVAGSEPKRVVEQLTRTIDRGLPVSNRSELTRSLAQILTSLYVVRDDQDAGRQLARFEMEPAQYAKVVTDEILTASHYLTPNNANAEARSRARELFGRILVSCFGHLRKVDGITGPKERAQVLKALMSHIDEIATRIYFALDVKDSLRTPERALEEDQRRELYFEVKPLIASLAQGSEESAEHHLLPHTAHYLLESLNGVLEYDPGAVIEFAAHVCKAASSFSYQFDAMAISEIVKLVEHSLADHKEILKDPTIANALGDILDIFVKAGWPDALQLTFKLDQAVR